MAFLSSGFQTFFGGATLPDYRRVWLGKRVARLDLAGFDPEE